MSETPRREGPWYGFYWVTGAFALALVFVFSGELVASGQGKTGLALIGLALLQVSIYGMHRQHGGEV